MLFNSHQFLLVFLPVSLAAFYFLGRFSPRWSAGFLALASVGFYTWWDIANLAPLFLSIAVNYVVGILLVHGRTSMDLMVRRMLLTSGLVFDLGMLGWYKYSGFLASLAAHFETWLPHSDVLLPLGISFFTFTQIAFLMDAYRGEAKEYDPILYLLFVTFFPHLIAGPIIHHKEMMPQFAAPVTYRPRSANIALGLTIAVIGLCKKVFLADRLAPFADSVFTAAATTTLTLFESWMGALAYTFQIYFDFSGYSEMAVGFALMFNIVLPWNFNSPYRATSIIEFWRRWHMTLSRFLRDYLYFPLGGNRLGHIRTYLNVFVVMVLGGLWHGAGWTFITWGAIHGVLILVNHALRDTALLPADGHTMRFVGWLLTFVAVVFAWVFFRSPDMTTALSLTKGMLGLHGATLGDNHRQILGPLVPLLEHIGLTFVRTSEFSFLSLPWLAGSAAMCFLLPNLRAWVSFDRTRALSGFLPAYQATALWGVIVAGATLAVIITLGGPSQFLYFNF